MSLRVHACLSFYGHHMSSHMTNQQLNAKIQNVGSNVMLLQQHQENMLEFQLPCFGQHPS